MNHEINYITDSIDGAKTSITSTDQGWVEYAREMYHIYATKSFPEDLYNRMYNSFISAYRKTGVEFFTNIGFIAHLERILSVNNFTLPVFGEITGDTFHLNCGNSRFVAHMSSGKDLAEFGLVVFSKEKLNRGDFVEVTSSQQFIEFFNLKDIDFSIGMDRVDDSIRVKYSSLRHTFYANSDPEKNGIVFKAYQELMHFWQRFIPLDGDKISLTVHCLPEDKKFVNPSSLFDIKFVEEDPAAWGFSFGRLLGAFRHDKSKQGPSTDVKLWLFNPTQNFDLELFIPLLSNISPCVYTKNQKAVIFDANSYADFRICGDIVK